MKYLVTGSCGFIGSNLVDMLVNQGHEVIGIDNLSSDAHDEFYFNSKAIYYHYSVTDHVMCSDVFKRHRPDVVFHLAAEVSIQKCIEEPGLCIETNVTGTETILALCKKYGVSRMVFMSTSAVYGKAENCFFGVGYVAQKETDRLECLNPYSLSKKFGEELCGMYSRDYGLDTVCFRGFNIYGNRERRRGAYAPVMGIFNKQKEEKSPLTIFGDGRQRRDFVHVEDVCLALIKGAEAKEAQKAEIYNIGTGKNYSVNEIARMIGGETVNLPPRNGEVLISLADISKIQEKLGWTPKHSLESVYIQ